ncbi:MAG: PEP-CTERM sorting domain-containing protein [Verrucomicrobiia bacterium]|jgi:T5SS/PEP-CTERM-associated repeat protein
MKGLRRRYLIVGILIGAVVGPCPSKAQYTADFQTNIISGVTSNWDDFYALGATNSGDVLLVENGGVLVDGFASIGSQAGANNNVAIISDPGSIWSNGSFLNIGESGSGNELFITDGAAVNDQYGYVGSNASSSNNTAVVDGSRSVWNNTQEFTFGWFGSGNRLIVTNGGAIYGWDCYLGGGNTSVGNTVSVSGSGSTVGASSNLYIGYVSAGNRVTISDGGLVFDANGYVGTSSNNFVVVTGSGSVWSNRADLTIGTSEYMPGNQLTITNGGAVYDNNGSVDGSPYPTSTVVSVSGNGARWCNSGNLSVGGGEGLGNCVTIGEGGSVVASNSYVSPVTGSTSYNGITVCGGALFVTNALHTGTYQNTGLLTLNSGTLTVDSLISTQSSHIVFSGGVLNAKSSAISTLAVGNGTNVAIFNLAPGGSGIHWFTYQGLSISSNAMLTGGGTIIGRTTVQAGGTLVPGGGAGSIAFSSNLTLAAGSTLAITIDGPGAGQYSQITGLGTISVSNCVLSVSLGYTPSPGDSFTIISNLTSMAVLGTFVDTAGAALPNGADFVVDNTTFQIDYSANCDGMDVALTALIPEPSSLLLTALGAVALCALLRRRRH